MMYGKYYIVHMVGAQSVHAKDTNAIDHFFRAYRFIMLRGAALSITSWLSAGAGEDKSGLSLTTEDST